MTTKEAVDSQTNSNQDIREVMSDVVNNPDGISVVIERTFSRGTIAAPANEEHFRELAGLLAEIDLSSISEEHEGLFDLSGTKLGLLSLDKISIRAHNI